MNIKKLCLIVVSKLMKIINTLLIIIGMLIGGGLGILSFLSLICLVVGIIIDLPNKLNIAGIMIVTFILKIIIVFILGHITILLESFKDKIEKI